MTAVEITGVDPGLVHTGCVRLRFDTELVVETGVFPGSEPARAAEWVKRSPTKHVFVEAYTNRASAYGGDQEMLKLMAQLKLLLPKATVLDNMGVKQVVTRQLMEKLHCWKFATPTHHQDLRSAARIAIYGALKDPDLNQMIYDYLEKELDKP